MGFRLPRTTVLIVAAMLSGVAMAQAQNTVSPRDPKACAPGADSHLKVPDTPTTAAPQTPNATNGNAATLSDKLAQSDGVLCPPSVDPDIRAPTPNAGSTPVIPPPGSPGGNPDVRPK